MKRLLVFIILLVGCALYAENTSGSDVPASAESVPVPSFIDLSKADLSAAPEVHVVIKGDTLWDLSSTYLKSPWYWPKIWSINPQIANPNLIYPGDKISFRDNGEVNVPGDEMNTDMEEIDEPGEDETFAQTGRTLDETPDNYKNFVSLGGKFRVNQFKEVDDTIFDAPKKGWVSVNEVEKNSTDITGAFEPKELLSSNDTFYVKMNKVFVPVGEYVQIYRFDGEIDNPNTGDLAGYRISILGKGKVIDINKKDVATVKIVKAYDYVGRGDRITPWQELPTNVKITRADAKIKATVLSGFEDRSILGSGNIVFLDKGLKNGLELGNMLTIYRQADGLDEADEDDVKNFPSEKIAEVVVIKADEKTATAIITKSLIDVVSGDTATSEEIEN